ncbi:zinc ribbon domain-containing protein [Sphingomonas parapaucimobilis]|uniref:zinc ribbon domain-containing protein n=1 Tax=Sphingomonas parapaucimobilis TaxID=28213 RepID=UPI0035C87EBA
MRGVSNGPTLLNGICFCAKCGGAMTLRTSNGDGGQYSYSTCSPMWAGARALGPWLLRGVAAAFGYLSNPVGWAILAASAALLVWNYHKEIAGAWHSLTSWFTNTAWPAIKSTVMSVDWGAVGSSIVDGMTFGLASKLPNMLSTVHRFLKSEVGFNMKDGLTLTPPAVAGARASGGPISWAGRGWWASRARSLSCPIARAL